MKIQLIEYFFYSLFFILPLVFLSISYSNKEYSGILVSYYIFILFIITAVLTSLRGVEGDTELYSNLYYRTLDYDSWINFNADNRAEGGYLIINYLLAKLGFDFRFLLFIIPAFFSLTICSLTKKIFLRHRGIQLFVSVVIVLSPFFYSLNANVMRQAVCLGFLFLLYKACFTERYLLAVLYALVASSFHTIGFFGVVIVFYFKYLNFKPSHWLFLVVIFSLLSLFNFFDAFTMYFFSSLSSEYYSNYGTGAHAYYRTGFRLDFLLMNLIPFTILYILRFKLSYQDQVIITASCMWSLLHIAFFSMPYSDRIGVNSWILYPLILGICLKYLIRINRVGP